MAAATTSQQHREAAAAAEPQQFPWEAPHLTGAFWDNFPDPNHHLARSVGRLFSPYEFARLHLDPAADPAHKQAQLHAALEQHMPDSDQPEALSPDAYGQWHTRGFVLAALERDLGRDDEAESRLRQLAASWEKRHRAGGTDGTAADPETVGSAKDVGALNNLAFLLAARGRCAEAEAVARELAPLLDGAPLLGRTSPQALGNRRLLIECVARQGRAAEAERLCVEVYGVVGEMAGTKFAKYEEEERVALHEVRGKLGEWVAESKRV
jgi:hypothetical protein